MTTFIATLLIVLVGLAGYIAWRVTANQGAEDTTKVDQKLDSMQKEMTRMGERLTDKLHEGMKDNIKVFQDQFRGTSDIVKKVTEELTTLRETNKQVLGFSEQLQDLQKILKQPKGRGLLGEYWLETMLGHVLQPGQFALQYKFKNGDIVDAVVLFQEKVIPIDAKFPLDKYSALMGVGDAVQKQTLEKGFREDLKKRIDETAKYIRPSDGTTDFAFMFLPAEGIYYDLLVNDIGATEINRRNLVEYAFEKKVVIVSPATFFAYLQTVLQGLKAFRMQESVHEIQKNVETLGKHILSYESLMQNLGKNLGATVGKYNEAYTEFRKIDKDVVRLTDGAVGGTVTPLTLERPITAAEEAFESAAKKLTSSTRSRETAAL